MSSDLIYQQYEDTLRENQRLTAQLAERDARIAELTAAGDVIAVYLETEEHSYSCGIWRSDIFARCTCGRAEAREGWRKAKGEG